MRRFLRAATALAGVAIAAAPLAAFELSRFDRGVSVLMLKQIKRDLKANYYDRSFHGVDIDAVFEAAEARIRAAGSLSDAMDAIAAALSPLRDSHTTFYPPERLTRVHEGWRAGVIGDAAFVVQVEPGSDAAARGLRVGDRLVRWNDAAASRGTLRQLAYRFRLIAPQAVHHLVVADGDGRVRAVDVNAALSVRRPAAAPEALAEDLAEALAPRQPDEVTTKGDVLVWRLRSFGDERAIGRTIKQAGEHKALVLDLRGNGGGSIHAMQMLLSRLFSGPVAVGSVHGRDGVEALEAGGRRGAFTGRLAVIVDSGTASAAEIAAATVQRERRGWVIGDRTAGAVMTSRVFSHTTGVRSIAFYAVSISIGEFRLPDGRRLEGAGVTPDEVLLPSPGDLAAGRDPVLDRAIASVR